MKKLSIIGLGNMGGAILRGLLRSGKLPQELLTGCDADPQKIAQLQTEFPQAHFLTDPVEAIKDADFVLFAVKPNILGAVLKQLSNRLSRKAVISIAAGWMMEALQASLPADTACLRVMPNTPAMVGEGLTAICTDTSMSQEQLSFACGIFEAVGQTVLLPERLFDAVTALSGSSPAYFFMLLEAMGDAGVREGLPRKTAYEIAAQAMLGSAVMALRTGSHPGELKDAVCSPAGTTIEAVAVLEKSGFRSAVIDAVHACAEKSKSMSQQ